MSLLSFTSTNDLNRKTERLLRELHKMNRLRIGSMAELDAYECALLPARSLVGR